MKQGYMAAVLPFKLSGWLLSERKSCLLNVDRIEWKLVVIPIRDWCVSCEGLLQFYDSCNLCNPTFVFFYLLFGTHICKLSITRYSRWHSSRRHWPVCLSEEIPICIWLQMILVSFS